MNRPTSCCVLLAGLLGLLSHTSPDLAAQDTAAPRRQPDHLVLAKACNRFGQQLYLTLAKDGTPTCAPGSVAMALAMLLPGARGQTADEIAAVLQLPKELRGERLLTAAAKLIASSTDRRGDVPAPMRITNDVWVQQNFPLVPAYGEALTAHFDAAPRAVDFASDPEAARKRINAHIAKATNGRIKELLDPRMISGMTRVVLTNAIWFKDAWRHAFPMHATEAAPFTRADGTRVEVPMMKVVERFRLASSDQWSAIVMPFGNSTMQFEAIVPADGATLAQAERALLGGGHLGKLRSERVQVRMPRFRAAESHNLVDALRNMGMPTAFSGGADFSGIESSGSLIVSRVEHKVWIDVAEHGAEATAATAVVLKERGARPHGEPRHFDADRPFVFGLRDRKTGLLWFVGRVDNPSISN